MIRKRFALVTVALAVLATACASTGGNQDGAAGTDPNAVTIAVTNAVVPPAAVTVWIVPQTGSRRRLGTIQPNQQGTFTFSPFAAAMEHTLVADHVGGGSTTSNPFVLSGVSQVTWQTSSPAVSIVRQQP